MEHANEIKNALTTAVKEALMAHLDENGTLKNLDWFNVSAETTDFYDSVAKENVA